MPIPKLDQSGELPEGVHEASLNEIKIAFATNKKRRELYEGLQKAVSQFKDAGVVYILVDGSYTTNKESPNDIDGCWSAEGNVDPEKIDPDFWDFESPQQAKVARANIMKKYGLDFFIAEWIEGDSGVPFSEFFQTDRSQKKKGIIKLMLQEESK